MIRLCLMIGGVLQLGMAVFHATFPWLFRWEQTLACLANAERAIVYTFQWAVVITLCLFAYASLACRRELAETRLGHAVLASVTLVWLLRATAEVGYYRIGADGEWLRVLLFAGIAALYALPLLALTGGRAVRTASAGGGGR